MLKMAGRILNAITIAGGYALNLGQAILQGIWGIIKALPGLVWGLLNDAIAAFKSMVSAAFQAAKDFAGGLWDGFKAGLGIHSPSFIERAAWQITGVLTSEAKKWDRVIKLTHKLGAQMNNMSIRAPRWDQPNFRNVAGDYMSTKAARNRFSTSSKAMAPELRERLNNSGPTQINKEYNFDIKSINPKKERTSDSVQRKLSQIRTMGLLDALGDDN
jgi:hypothetical protein